jgi:hypothetical protein
VFDILETHVLSYCWMCSNTLSRTIVSTLLVLATLTATSARGLCLKQRTTPNCCDGKCQAMNMPLSPGGSNNCCAVSHGDRSQPAVVRASTTARSDTPATISRIDLSFLLGLPFKQPLSSGLANWHHTFRHNRDLPTLICALLI